MHINLKLIAISVFFLHLLKSCVMQVLINYRFSQNANFITCKLINIILIRKNYSLLIRDILSQDQFKRSTHKCIIFFFIQSSRIRQKSKFGKMYFRNCVNRYGWILVKISTKVPLTNLRRADVNNNKSNNVAINAWLPQPSYPCNT